MKKYYDLKYDKKKWLRFGLKKNFRSKMWNRKTIELKKITEEFNEMRTEEQKNKSSF